MNARASLVVTVGKFFTTSNHTSTVDKPVAGRDTESRPSTVNGSTTAPRPPEREEGVAMSRSLASHVVGQQLNHHRGQAPALESRSGLGQPHKINRHQKYHPPHVLSLNGITSAHVHNVHPCSLVVKSPDDSKRTLTPFSLSPRLLAVDADKALRAWRHHLGLSQMDLALRAEIERVTVSRYENPNKKRRDHAVLERLTAALGLSSVDVLLAGPGAASTTRPTDGSGAPIDETQERFASVPPLNTQEVVMAPLYDGFPSTFSNDDPQYRGTIPFPRAKLRHAEVVAILLTDDAMFPDFPAGCYVVVDLKVTTPYQGEPVVVRLANGSTVFRHWRRASRNAVTLAPGNRSWGPGTPFDAEHDRVLGVCVATINFHNARRVR